MPLKTIADVPDRARFSHLLWLEALPLITVTWGNSVVPEERDLAAFLSTYLPALDQPRRAAAVPPQRSAPKPAPDPCVVPGPVPGDVMTIAREVQGDQGQRAVPTDVGTPQWLEAIRLELRDRLVSDDTTSNVRTWLWRAASLGQPLIEQGRCTSYELRLSYYRSPW